MRALVFVLALANLLFFAYVQGYFGHSENIDALRMAKQLNADSLHIVSRGEAPAPATANPETPIAPDASKEAPKESAKEAPKDSTGKEPPAKEVTKEAVKEAAKEAPPICAAWTNLSTADADKLAGLLGDKFSDFRLTRRSTPAEGGPWWVFIPPQTSKADADKKASELKKLGVSDFYIIQDAGPNRWAISLGVFSAESGAKGRLNELKDAGVKSAKLGPRNSKDAIEALEARGPAARQETLNTAIASALPTLRPQTCP